MLPNEPALKVLRVERPWGEVFTPDDLAPVLAAKPKAVGIVMAETSTGAYQSHSGDLPGSTRRRQSTGGGFRHVVGRCTRASGRVAGDAIYSGSQKCLSCPPGLAPVSFFPGRHGSHLEPQDQGAELVFGHHDAG